MPPAWLTALSWAALAVAFASTAPIAYDIFGRGYRQHMTIMETVWPVTGLYFGPAAIAAYRAWGRPESMRWQREHGEPPDKPGYAVTATGVSHCGAGCTIGDIIAEFAVFGLGATVAGLTEDHGLAGSGHVAIEVPVQGPGDTARGVRGMASGRGLAAPLVAGLVRPSHIHDLDRQVPRRVKHPVSHRGSGQQPRPA